MHFLCLTLTEVENLIFLPYMERCEIPKLTFHKYLIQSTLIYSIIVYSVVLMSQDLYTKIIMELFL